MDPNRFIKELSLIIEEKRIEKSGVPTTPLCKTP
jgi:hypothetical protein